MDLFSDENTNLLPKDGEVYYLGKILSDSMAEELIEKLLTTIDWQTDELIMFGKRIETKRKVAWFGDEPYEYTYSNTTKKAQPWTNELIDLKHLVEKYSNETYNSCLLNLYHSGEEGMGWHTDNERELKKNGAIASLSLGAERIFSFKHNEETISTSVLLENGSLLVMKGLTQTFWKHRLPPTKKTKRLRIKDRKSVV